MIFSRFFTPDHAKPDPKIRKSAIEKLSPEEPKSKQILHELAFNDESPEVNLAALTKLDSFALWQKMSQIAKNDRVRKTAQNTVRDAILSSGQLSMKERKAFLLESADSTLLAQALEQGGELLEDVETALKLIERVAKQTTVDLVFSKHANADLQKALVQQESDLQTLQRWAKKAPNKALIEDIETKIAELEEAKLKPQRITQSVTLVLSKLLALTEKTDYEHIVEQRVSLEKDYLALASEFDLLKDRDKDAFGDKKATIDQKLDSLEQRLKVEFEAEKKLREAENVRSELAEELGNAQLKVTGLFNNLQSATLSEFEALQNHMQSLADAIEAKSSLIGRAVSEPLAQKVAQLTQKITRVPEWQRHTEKMGALLSELNEQVSGLLNTPEQISDELPSLNKRFYDLYDAASPLAESHLSRWKTLQKEANKAKKTHIESVKAAADQLRKSLNITGSLISQGKYRAAMQRFSGFTEKWNQATDSSKRAVQRKFDEIAEQVERLEGWQSYLAAPRKPSLLEEAKNLVEDATLSMPQRAEKIKLLRKQWLSLSSHTELSDEEKALSEAFDEALEKAFAPCREYFAAQEQKRKDAITRRESLIDELTQLLADQNLDNSELLAQSETLRNAWHDSDAIPQQDYKPLKIRFDALSTDVQLRLKPFFEGNKYAKENLIKKAENLLNDEHNPQTTENAKALQQDWKLIGSAGSRIDGKLWKVFREINNKIFARAKETGLARKEALNADIEYVQSTVNAFSEEASTLEDGVFFDKLNELKAKLRNLPKNVQQSLEKRLTKQEKLRSEAAVQAQRELRAKEVKTLKNILGELTDDKSKSVTDLVGLSALPKAWQQALTSQPTEPQKDMEGLLITLEILLSIESPDNVSERRTQLQMKLLSESFNAAERPEPLEIIDQCLRQFNAADVNLMWVQRFIQCVDLAYLTQKHQVR